MKSASEALVALLLRACRGGNDSFTELKDLLESIETPWTKVDVTRSGTITVGVAQNNTLFVASGAATFTLPAPARGLKFRFLQTADANLAVVGNGNIIAINNSSLDSVTFSTSSQKIGSHLLVEAQETAAGVYKWVVSNLGSTTMTLA